VHHLAKTNRPGALTARSGLFTPGTPLGMLGGTKNRLVMSVTKIENKIPLFLMPDYRT
jgi:hypothetical protein